MPAKGGSGADASDRLAWTFEQAINGEIPDNLKALRIGEQGMQDTPLTQARLYNLARMKMQERLMVTLESGKAVPSELYAKIINERLHYLAEAVAYRIAIQVTGSALGALMTGGDFIAEGATPLKDADVKKSRNYGAFGEEGILGLTGQRNLPLPDWNELQMEVKLVTTKPDLTQQKGINVGTGHIIVPKLADGTTLNLSFSDIWTPEVRITTTVWKMLAKMNSFLYFNVYERNATHNQHTLSFKAIQIFTELYIKRLIEIVASTMDAEKAHAKLEKIGGFKPAAGSSDILGSIQFRVMLSQKEKASVLENIQKLSEIYLGNIGVMNQPWWTDDASRDAFVGVAKIMGVITSPPP